MAHCLIVEGGEGVLLVWASGEFTGDLGAPRLNQRVAMHAEGLLRREAEGGLKVFDTPDGKLTVKTTIHTLPKGPDDGPETR